jgi:hypothetical protein
MTPFGSPSQKPQNPPDKPTEAEKPPDTTKLTDELATAGGCLGVLVVVFFLVAIFILPHIDPNREQLDKAAGVRDAIMKLFTQGLSATDVELRQLGGYNLEIWIPQREFESISYLDRKALMDAAGRDWCTMADFLLCPTVVVRDEKKR